MGGMLQHSRSSALCEVASWRTEISEELELRRTKLETEEIVGGKNQLRLIISFVFSSTVFSRKHLK